MTSRVDKRARAIELRGSLWMAVGGRELGGSGRVELLRAVAEQGSITHGAKAVGMSYKAAWDAIDPMNTLAGAALVERSTGGRGGGSTRLTPWGMQLVERFVRRSRRFTTASFAFSATKASTWPRISTF